MNPRTEAIPDLRQPSAREAAWISGQWGAEAQQTVRRPRGQITRYIGIFLIAVSVAGMLREDVDVASTFIVLVLAAACLIVSHLNRRTSKEKDRLLYALAQGEYLVAPAFSTRVYYGQRRTFTSGLLTACLPDGRPLDGVYRLPYRCAKPLIEGNVHRVPILLIRISGYSEILAIPVEK